MRRGKSKEDEEDAVCCLCCISLSLKGLPVYWSYYSESFFLVYKGLIGKSYINIQFNSMQWNMTREKRSCDSLLLTYYCVSMIVCIYGISPCMYRTVQKVQAVLYVTKYRTTLGTVALFFTLQTIPKIQ
jgi:hypothetical protein